MKIQYKPDLDSGSCREWYMKFRSSWMDDNQWECWQLVGRLFNGFHHVFCKPKEWGNGICIDLRSISLSTFDFNGLTRLVFLCHDMCIRCDIAPSGPGKVKLCLWKRDTREGRMSDRHPTVEAALGLWRKSGMCASDSEGGE